MFCSRYNKICEEALYHNCDAPSESISIKEQLQDCVECAFCEVENEQSRTLEY